MEFLVPEVGTALCVVYDVHMTNTLQALTIHDVIDDLCRQARAIAPRIADESLDAGCTNERPIGPRQAEAFRLVESAFALNAVAE